MRYETKIYIDNTYIKTNKHELLVDAFVEMDAPYSILKSLNLPKVEVGIAIALWQNTDRYFLWIFKRKPLKKLVNLCIYDNKLQPINPSDVFERYKFL